MNPGAYTHTSIALFDALKASEVPLIEVHISNPMAREPYRRTSWVASAATGCVWCLGIDGYRVAIDALVNKFG